MQIYIQYNPKHKSTKKKSGVQPWLITMKGGEWVKVDHITSFVGFSTKETPICKGVLSLRGEIEFSKTQDGKTWIHIHPERRSSNGKRQIAPATDTGE